MTHKALQTSQELYHLLDISPLLKGSPIPPSVLSTRTCTAGQMISGRLAGSTAVGLVTEGMIDVYSVAPDGRDVQLNTLHPGDCFGISNLLLQEDLETVLRCRTDTRLILIPKDAFIAAMEQDSSFALRYAACCNEKIQFLLHRIERLTMQSCRGKVIEYLLSQQDKAGCVYPGCSREDLARRLGVSRAALFRELSSLTTQGLLAQENGHLIILDRDSLTRTLFQG